MNTHKKILLTSVLMGVVTLVWAHEFWLQPDKFLLKIGETIDIRIFVGENFQGEKWPDTKDKIVKLMHYSGVSEEEIVSKVPDNDHKRINISFQTAGNHLIAFNNKNKFIKLEAAKFNEYLKTEGLDDAAKQRKEQNNWQKEGRELYQRCVKTLVQVGDKHDDTYKKNTGMTFELIPERNPYLIQPNQSEIFTVLYKNQPLPNALVLAWHRHQGKTTMKQYRSNAKGQIQCLLKRQGRWMISAVHMVPHTNPQEADWQSYWTSYTFGYL